MVKISVIMPVYGRNPYIHEAVESVLNQSFRDFELFIISEEPSSETESAIDSFQDSRIEYISADGNGISAALNQGIESSTGQYIARMDADDIASKKRFAAQQSFLCNAPEVGIVGSCCHLINPDGCRCGLLRVPYEDYLIRFELLLSNPIPHPSAMIRREVLERHSLRYNTRFDGAEDYDLWTRMLKHTKAANIQTPLLEYRIEDDSKKSVRDTEVQKNLANEISCREISKVASQDWSKGEVATTREYFFGSGRITENDCVEKYIRLTEAFADTCGQQEQVKGIRRNALKRVLQNLFSSPRHIRGFRSIPSILGLLLRSLL